jgi:hypothetical protein
MNAGAIAKALRLDYLTQPVLSADCWKLIYIGALFWGFATFRDTAFSEEVYGAFALRFPAEMWAALMMFPSAMVIIGLHDPVKRWMVAAGSTILTVQFCALGYSAVFTGGEPIIGVFCYVFFAPRFARMVWEAAIDP